MASDGLEQAEEELITFGQLSSKAPWSDAVDNALISLAESGAH
jgi:hypothetical protein